MLFIGQFDLALKDRGGGAGHQHGLAQADPFNGQPPAARIHIHPAVQQAQADAGHYGGAGTGAAGQRLARAALMHAQAHPRAADHLHEAGVDAVGKTRVVLDQRALGGDGRGVHVIHHLHGMGVAHGQDGHGNDGALGRRAQRQLPGLPATAGLRVDAGGIKRNQRGIKHRRAHVHRDAAVRVEPGLDHT